MNRPEVVMPMSNEEFREKLERWRRARAELAGMALGQAMCRWTEASRVTTLLEMQLAAARSRQALLWEAMESERAVATPLVKRLDAEVRALCREVEAELERREALGL